MTARHLSSAPAESRRQFAMLRADLAVMLLGQKRRLLTCWMHQRFWAVFCYRLERAAFLFWGPAWPWVGPLVKLALALIRPPGVEISYKARLGAGLAIYHPGLGVVVAPETEAGERLVLTGGNCIGVRRVFRPGDRLLLGDRVVLGANAVVLGPIRIGDDVRLGAGAVAARDVPDRAVVRAPSSSVNLKDDDWPRSASGADSNPAPGGSEAQA